MTAFTAEFLPVAKAPPAELAGNERFIPISFRRKRMSELCEGYYCIELAGGRTEFVEAASALDALRLAQSMGVVIRIQRESLQRRRMVRSLVNPDAAPAEEESPLIKPGTVLLSFETLCRWQDRKDGVAPAISQVPGTVSTTELVPEMALAAHASGGETVEGTAATHADEVQAEASPSSAAEVAASILAQVQRPAEP